MQSELLTVDEYMLSVPPVRSEALNKIRALCQKYLAEADETMMYKMPTYLKDGVSIFAFNSQKNYISFYVMNGVLDKYRDKFKNCGKGCIRFQKPSEIDFHLIEQILQDDAK